MANQVQNLDSVQYGNPRRKSYSGATGCASFQFVPYAQAEGIVRDQWTGERLAGAADRIHRISAASPECTIAIQCPPPIAPTGSVARRQFPDQRSSADRGLEHDRQVHELQRSDADQQNPRTGPGVVTNLGAVYLVPNDTTETHRGCLGSAVLWDRHERCSDEDTDTDGFSNLEEYRAGTAPKDDGSALVADEPVATAGSFALTWPVAAGRNYRVLTIGTLNSNDWTSSFGPQEATNGQQSMSWTDNGISSVTTRFYHVRAEVP